MTWVNLSDVKKTDPRLYYRLLLAKQRRDPDAIGVFLFQGVGKRWHFDPEKYEESCKKRTEDWLKENK